MIEIAMHALLPLAAFFAATFIERYKILLLSRILFWQWRSDIEGSYTSTWLVESPTPFHYGDSGSFGQPVQIEDLARIEFATRKYISGTGSNGRYGDYVFSGTIDGSAVTLAYRSKDKHLREHVGVAMLRIGVDGILSGYWCQNRPDDTSVLRGTTTWVKRPE